jgi:hypothetical protein
VHSVAAMVQVVRVADAIRQQAGAADTVPLDPRG